MKNYFIELHQLLFNKQKRKDILLSIVGTDHVNLYYFKIISICLCISSLLAPILIMQTERSEHFITLFKDLNAISIYVSLVVYGFIILFNLFMINSIVLNFIIYKLKITKMNTYQLFNIFSYLSIPAFITTIFISGIFLIFNISIEELLIIIPIISVFIFYVVFIWAISLLRQGQNFISTFLKYFMIIVSILIQLILTSGILGIYFINVGFSYM